MKVVVVESPAKARTINKYLGSDYRVLASFGHVRDLPSKDGSVRPEEDFAMTWAVDSDSNKRLKDIADAVKGADGLYLATDPDREGEAISWHVLEVLAKKKALNGRPVHRVVFNEITKPAVVKAMAEPREIDKELVDAYLARRALDYLVGFTLSPILWRKLPGARSAGRVQSVALRLICDREIEIDKFVPQEYWSITTTLATPAGDTFKARLAELDGTKLKRLDIKDQAAAEAAVAAIRERDLAVAQVESKPQKRHPQPPFTTSTLQQEASRKLGFSASRTMRTAQKLYEGKTIDGTTTGLITYMRTDGVSIAQEAITGCRDVIGRDYGKDYVPDAPRIYKSKAKNAQEAHEAVRPVDLARRPADVARALDDDERRLYELIWKRTIASQMESAVLERTTADIRPADGKLMLRATGQVVRFDGFLKLYQEGRDDEADENGDGRLPPLEKAMALETRKIEPKQHFTEPPPRYSEASLVKKLEELGIGRPSTYASILSVLRERNYVRMERNKFVAEDKGQLVIAFLENFFERYVEYDFTAKLEQQLDEISAGKAEWKTVLRQFWNDFEPKTQEVMGVRNAVILEALNEHLAPHVFKVEEEGVDPRACTACEDGRLSLKVGRYGAFIGCSNYPECRFTRQLGNGEDQKAANGQASEPQVLGVDPETGREISLRDGRFGPYVQREAEGKEKPARASIPKDVTPDRVDLKMALALLNLPRLVGEHPSTGEPIKATIGRYGPYLSHGSESASLQSTEDVFTIGINRAVTVLAEGGKRGGRAAPKVLRELGAHPDDGETIALMDGRYGPYVKHKKINATVPRGKDVDSLTLDEAVELLKAKAAKGGRKKRRKKSAA
ncbi:MAG: type I DNA topoisomerase [Sphingomonadales bacterium]|nr:type I DNA topoisomerase [Sphingomonadales bacterium]